ncbi:DUF3710 domain-containing protein [Aestuariimicrobium kwangyangense]|uniref:DUF3710 domain-containing protein n=1 Tax=Aestuariimicrobium kwangyangense TaxID=396389 RepID=UPI0003B3542A|nr:DUF3710 domain-containing protein [Aestuariimicrobium kwangyangense]
MIFGRKKKVDEGADEVQHGVDPQAHADELLDDEGDRVRLDDPDTPDDDELDDDDDLDDDDLDDDDDLEEDDDEDDDLEEDDDDDDRGRPVDSSLRADGPFDIEEVDLDADEVDRLDFGTLIITPFEDMQMQLQADQTTNEVQSALIMAGQSALELALFAAPLTTSMVDEVVAEVVNATPQQGGETQVQEGPYGPDVRRTVPVQNEQGEQLMHVSRTWYAQGPRWLLRGTLMGQAALADDFSSPDAELLLEVFRNTVVRRGTDPKVPGDLIPMSLPESMVPVEG